MRWYEITINLPLVLLGTVYDFLWLYANGLNVKKEKNNFLIKAYLFSSSPESFLKKFNKFLNPLVKRHNVSYPILTIKNPSNPINDFLLVPIPNSYIPSFGIPILLQRGKAFGNGRHPCTIYCLEALKDIFYEKFNDYKVLDAGTGTGILSIGAAKLGAKEIIGVEINPESVKEAQENVKLNNLTDKIKILHCSVTEIKGEFNLIFANLYGILLKQIAPILVKQLTSGGWLVLGGMIVPDDDVVVSIFNKFGLKEFKRFQDEEWSVAILKKL